MSSEPALKKRKAQPQRYLKAWEQDARFTPWLRSSTKGDGQYHCTACNFDGCAGLSEIIRHSNTKSHQKAACAMKAQVPISVALNTQPAKDIVTVKQNEIQMASFIVEHNLAFNVSSHLTGLIKSVAATGPKIASQIQMGRTKATMIAKNVLGADELDQLVQMLKIKPFSLIVDESTDLSCIKQLAAVVRLVDDDMRTKDIFLFLKEVADANAQGLFKIISGMLSRGFRFFFSLKFKICY